MTLVGIIANPSSGKDIRRLVALGSVSDNNEKANTVKRILAGLLAVGVDRIAYMPDSFGIVARAVESTRGKLHGEPLDMPMYGVADDSSRAARAMSDQGVGCIISLGGDGTNRAIARGSGNIPLLPISTGTNNVFPIQVEGTLAGIAAGLVATGAVPADVATFRAKRLEVRINADRLDHALVDVALVRETYVGARAVWNPEAVQALMLAIAEPGSIGLSSIGAHLLPVSRRDPLGVWLTLPARHHRDGHSLPGPHPAVLAPIAPGLVVRTPVVDHGRMLPDQPYEPDAIDGVVALDGEREFTIRKSERIEVTLRLDGPRVIDFDATLAHAANTGAFVALPAADR